MANHQYKGTEKLELKNQKNIPIDECFLREGMVISQFIKGRFDEIGDNRKGYLEEGMIKQKFEKIAFK